MNKIDEKNKDVDEGMKTAIIGLLEYLPRSALLTLLSLITKLLDEITEDENESLEGDYDEP